MKFLDAQGAIDALVVPVEREAERRRSMQAPAQSVAVMEQGAADPITSVLAILQPYLDAREALEIHLSHLHQLTSLALGDNERRRLIHDSRALDERERDLEVPADSVERVQGMIDAMQLAYSKAVDNLRVYICNET